MYFRGKLSAQDSIFQILPESQTLNLDGVPIFPRSQVTRRVCVRVRMMCFNNPVVTK